MAAWVATVEPAEGYMPGEDLLGNILDWVVPMDEQAVAASVRTLNVHDRRYGDDSGKVIWDLIKELGHRMGTNFGLTFDPLTKRDGSEEAADEGDGR